MRKSWLILALAAVALSACAKTTPTAEPTALPTAAPTTAASATQQVADCTVSSIFPEPKAPLDVTVPRASDKDWSVGPADARMIVIEYSDFQ